MLPAPLPLHTWMHAYMHANKLSPFLPSMSTFAAAASAAAAVAAAAAAAAAGFVCYIYRDAVKKGQLVKVKVHAIAGSRLSLTMREVDQATGRDLKPRNLQSGNAGNECMHACMHACMQGAHSLICMHAACLLCCVSVCLVLFVFVSLAAGCGVSVSTCSSICCCMHACSNCMQQPLHQLLAASACSCCCGWLSVLQRGHVLLCLNLLLRSMHRH